MDLAKKSIVVTGGTSGFGLALATAFKNQGANVVVCARKKDGLKSFPRDGILGVRANVTKEKDVKKLAEFAVKKFGRIDIWVNNAGAWMPHLPIEKVDWGKAHELMEVNLFGMAYGSKVALADMRKRGSGIVINIISTSGLDGKKNETAYCASKFAASGFTKSLRKEVEGTDIRVLGVYPGGMKTNLFNEKKPENYEEYMDPNEVAEKVIENLKSDNPQEELVLRR